MGTELTTLDSQQLKELVAALPAKKRAAFSKAAKAAIQHLKDSKANYSKAYELASAMVENWRLLGVQIPKLGISPGQPKKNSPPGETSLLTELGINFNQSARCQKLAEKSKDELDEWLASKYDEGTYYLPSLRPAAEAAQNIVSSDSNEWYTPGEYIESARSVMGSIDVDPASCQSANETVKAGIYYDESSDGLVQEWHGNVWLNPPYGRLAGEFVAMAVKCYVEKSISSCVILVNSNCTDTQWFQCLWDGLLCFTDHRINFTSDDNSGESCSTHGSVFIYFGRAQRRFVSEFSKHGVVVKRA